MTHGLGSTGSDSAGPDPENTPAFADLLAAAGGDGEHTDAREVDVLEMGQVPSQEIILRVTMVLMSAAAEKLGLSDDDPSASPYRDLDEARRLIDALAGLVAGSVDYLGVQARTVRSGLQALQYAFRESSAYPDEPGRGPGEQFTGKLF